MSQFFKEPDNFIAKSRIYDKQEKHSGTMLTPLQQTSPVTVGIILPCSSSTVWWI
jgi:hypothetical protein